MTPETPELCTCACTHVGSCVDRDITSRENAALRTCLARAERRLAEIEKEADTWVRYPEQSGGHRQRSSYYGGRIQKILARASSEDPR